MSRVVLDASAVLAVLFQEQGHEQVADRSSAALISAVNLAEVASKMIERGLKRETALALVDQLNAAVVEFDVEQALRVGELRLVTTKAGLSLGDRACLALAEKQGWPLLTTDRSFASVQTDVAVELLR